jgi:CheY-like chemotaxis protein
MSSESSVLIEFIKASPALIVSIVGSLFLIANADAIGKLLRKATKLSALGVSIEAAGDTLDDAFKAHGLQGMASQRERMAVLRRLSACAPLLRGTRVLWVDDQPSNNEAEVKLLKSLDVEVQQVTTSADANAFLNIRHYLLVITDFDRDDMPTTGIDFAKLVASRTAAPPVIGYVGTPQSGLARPAHFFGVTNRPDHLMHLVCDVAQREGV